MTKTTGLKAIKGFNHDLTCRGYQFAPGGTYTVEGKANSCKNGFHACPDDLHPLTVFQFYAPGSSRYCDVLQSGDICRKESDKAASTILTINAEIGLGELTRRTIDWVMARVTDSGSNTNSGYGAASNSGDYGAASNSGTQGAASNSGDYGAASNSGTRGAASNSGTRGAASNSGYQGAAFSHAYGSKVMCEGVGQALYCTEFADDGSIASVACGITGRDGIKAGVWYHARAGELEPVT